MFLQSWFTNRNEVMLFLSKKHNVVQKRCWSPGFLMIFSIMWFQCFKNPKKLSAICPKNRFIKWPNNAKKCQNNTKFFKVFYFKHTIVNTEYLRRHSITKPLLCYVIHLNVRIKKRIQGIRFVFLKGIIFRVGARRTFSYFLYTIFAKKRKRREKSFFCLFMKTFFPWRNWISSTFVLATIRP